MKPTIADQIWSWVLPRRGDYRNPLRWSHENDWWWGPFTFSRSSYSGWGLIFTSFGGGEDDDRPASVRLTLGRNVLIARLPSWLVPGPTITRVYPGDGWESAAGRRYYENIDAHEYGFSISRSGTVGDSSFLQVKLGRSTHDSSTDRSWSCFLPWTQWRHVRHSYYDLQGKLFETVPERGPYGTYYKGSILGAGMGYYDVMREIEERVPKLQFRFLDFDGEEIMATTHIEEREWRKGEGKFKWLSWFRKPIIRRSLAIEFSSEVGKRKGSWKGGTTGTSIEMERGPDGQFWEGALGAFLRYCTQNDLTFVAIGDWPDDVKAELTPKGDDDGK